MRARLAGGFRTRRYVQKSNGTSPQQPAEHAGVPKAIPHDDAGDRTRRIEMPRESAAAAAADADAVPERRVRVSSAPDGTEALDSLIDGATQSLMVDPHDGDIEQAWRAFESGAWRTVDAEIATEL